MATLEKRGEVYRVVFYYDGTKYSRSLKTNDEKTANGSLARAEEILRRIELGTLQLTPDADLASLVVSDGLSAKKQKVTKSVTLEELFKAYFKSLPEGSLEAITIEGMDIHKRLLIARIGAHFPMQTLAAGNLQDYINKRSEDKGRHGRKVTPTTIRKAIVTLRTVWNWGVRQGLLVGTFPSAGLIYPKGVEKSPFMTFEEISELCEHTPEQEHDILWEALFLTLPEIADVLDHVKKQSLEHFVYPMFVFTAHTGARRAEILRSKRTDIDFRTNMVTVHERKKSQENITTRRVPMSPLLVTTMRDWLTKHPGGERTFCHSIIARKGKAKGLTYKPLTHDKVHDDFKRALAGSKWEKIRGFHVFRHSFCSNCAAQGIDQRIINGWVGHLSEEMVRRYRHLIPNQQREAINHVFA